MTYPAPLLVVSPAKPMIGTTSGAVPITRFARAHHAEDPRCGQIDRAFFNKGSQYGAYPYRAVEFVPWKGARY